MSIRTSIPSSTATGGGGGGGENLYSLKWNHYHSYLTSGLAQLLQEDFSMTDVTLACEGQFIQAHKVALAVCSPFFKEYFKTYRMDKAGGLIVLANVKFKDLKNLIQFIYHGEVNVRNSDLNSFLRTANDLKIEGLADATKPGEEENPLVRPIDSKSQSSTSSPAPIIDPQRLSSSSSTQAISSSSSSSGGPPLKRSRLTIPSGQHAGSPISMQNQTLTSASQAVNVKRSEPSIPVVDHSKSTASAVQLPHQQEYDPLEMEDEQEEEMISYDEVKPEPISVYSLNDENDDENSLDHHGGDNLSSAMVNESSGIVYQDYSTSMSQQSVAGPSSSASLQAHHRMQQPGSAPKPQNKPSVNDESLEGSGSVSYQELIDVFLMKCKMCGESVTAEQFQTHACVATASEKFGTIEPVMCPNCGKTFKNKNSLKVHKSTYHRGPTSTSKVSSGTRLNSFADLNFTSVAQFPTEQLLTPVVNLDVTSDVIQLVQQTKYDRPDQLQVQMPPQQHQARVSSEKMHKTDAKFQPVIPTFTPSTRVELKKEHLAQAEQNVLLQQLTPTPVYFGDLDVLDTLQEERKLAESSGTQKLAQ